MWGSRRELFRIKYLKGHLLEIFFDRSPVVYCLLSQPCCYCSSEWTKGFAHSSIRDEGFAPLACFPHSQFIVPDFLLNHKATRRHPLWGVELSKGQVLLCLTTEMHAGWLRLLPYSWSWLHFPAEAAVASWASPLPRSHSVPRLLSLCLASVAWLVTPASSLEQVKGERNPEEITLLIEKRRDPAVSPTGCFFPFCSCSQWKLKSCWQSKKFLITQINIFF